MLFGSPSKEYTNIFMKTSSCNILIFETNFKDDVICWVAKRASPSNFGIFFSHHFRGSLCEYLGIFSTSIGGYNSWNFHGAFFHLNIQLDMNSKNTIWYLIPKRWSRQGESSIPSWCCLLHLTSRKSSKYAKNRDFFLPMESGRWEYHLQINTLIKEHSWSTSVSRKWTLSPTTPPKVWSYKPSLLEIKS